MGKLVSIFLFVLIATSGYSQDKKTYAFFMIGNYASPNWEKIAFDFTDSGKVITYSYRKNEQGHKLEPMGTKVVGNQKGLRVRMPQTDKTYVILKDRKNQKVIMMSEDGSYKKSFPLGYEGPINGRGTYCAVCANEPEEAFAIVDSFIR